MKRSQHVPLILLGALASLAGCSRSSNIPDTALQNSYANANDCRKDWGDGNWCNSTSSGHAGTVFVGPRYYWDRDAGRPMVIENGTARAVTTGDASRGAPSRATSVDSVPVARGGFGSTAHGGEGAHGGGGEGGHGGGGHGGGSGGG
jgi:hypothetical protein